MLKIAIPLANGQLCMHFGHCEEFAVIDVDETTKTILKSETMTPPPHEPGVIPRWIGSLGVKLVIAGGMGPMAQQLLAAQGVQVFAGASPALPEALVNAWLDGNLEHGDNVCDHADGDSHGRHGHGHNCHN